LGVKIKEKGVRRARDRYNGQERRIQGFGEETGGKEITWKI
jgi:hypothetical protein